MFISGPHFSNIIRESDNVFQSSKICNWSSIFRNDVSNFQEHSNIAKIQIYILPVSKNLNNYHYQNNNIYVKN